MVNHQNVEPPVERAEGNIDISLVAYMLKLSYEERIQFNDSAIAVARELERAGQEFYAGKLTKSP